jgi:hypothetical protein
VPEAPVPARNESDSAPEEVVTAEDEPDPVTSAGDAGAAPEDPMSFDAALVSFVPPLLTAGSSGSSAVREARACSTDASTDEACWELTPAPACPTDTVPTDVSVPGSTGTGSVAPGAAAGSDPVTMIDGPVAPPELVNRAWHAPRNGWFAASPHPPAGA